MATKKTTKKAIKKSYKAASSKTKSTKVPPKRGGKRGKKPNVPPLEDPIIVGGGSVPIVFDDKFNPSITQPSRKRRFDYSNKDAQVTGVRFLNIPTSGPATNIGGVIPIPRGANAVAVCYTGSHCGVPTSRQGRGRRA